MFDFSVTFFITIINIFILSIILRKLLFKPVTKFMAARTRRVQDSIDQSEKDKANANDLLAQYTAQLKTAENEANDILRSAREHAAAEAEKIIAESRISAETILANTKRQLEEENKTALAAFRKEAASLVVAAASRLVGREINSADNRQYAGMLLDEMPLPEEAGKN